MHLSESHYLIVFNEAFIPYNELQFLDWSSIVVHSPTGLMYIAYGLVILVHRNIQVTTLTIGYIQFCQGFECWDVEEELTKGIMQSLKWENFSNFSTKLIHVCKKLPLAVLEIKILLVPVNFDCYDTNSGSQATYHHNQKIAFSLWQKWMNCGMWNSGD